MEREKVVALMEGGCRFADSELVDSHVEMFPRMFPR